MYSTDIKELTSDNTNFRTVLHTGDYSQIVAMSLGDHEDIGFEIHQTSDQLLFFVSGRGQVVIGNESTPVEEHDVVFVPAGAEHNVINMQTEPLKLFTVYAPPTHADSTMHKTKLDAAQTEHSEVE